MKNLLCIFLFSFSMNVLAQTSVYHPFPDSNAVWVHSYGYVASPGCSCAYVTTSSLDGDTVMNTKNYKKIKVLRVEYCFGNCGSSPPSLLYSYVREDSTKKIWVYNYMSPTLESLAYDFDLNVGDTINTPYLVGSWPSDYIVQSIDSILVGNTYRKKYNYLYNGVHMSCTNFLIEGIGGGSGLFMPLCGSGCWPGPSFRLNCFKQNDVVMYYPRFGCPGYNSDTNYVCNSFIGIPENMNESSFTLHPNPATSELQIQSRGLGGTELRIEGIEIFSVVGETVLSFSSRRRSLKDEATIDISSLTSGIYFVKLKTEKGILTKKFIKQ